MAHIGIDLGTSNTLVATINADGEPKIIEIDGDRMIPSVIHIGEMGGHVSAGTGALDMWAEQADDTDKNFRRWKLHMGDDIVLRTLNFGDDKSKEVHVTPEKLTTHMVEYVVKELSKGLGGVPVESALVTVPHGWRREHPEKCRATRTAAAEAYCAGKPLVVQAITVSEPVAAAAYWLWEARKKADAGSFTNKTLMVCDVGGGTFDISLVVVGDSSKPLDVVDAINNNCAGDYVDALICSRVCKEFNALHGTQYPESADKILEVIDGQGMPWLRSWFLKVKKDFKEFITTRIENVTRLGKKAEEIKSISLTFDDPDDNGIKITMRLQDFTAWIEPFYEESRKLLKAFLAKIPKNRHPYAVVFAGGGSRIYGLREHVLIPVLQAFYSKSEAEAVLQRIEVNPRMLDQAIALGAALIANGIVSVQERLLYDIGVCFDLNENLLKDLNIPKESSEILLTPLLIKGALLPAIIKSTDLGLPLALQVVEEIEIKVVIDDNSQNPWIQSWSRPHPDPGTKEEQGLEWIIEADNDGALTVNLQPQGGEAISVEGRLSRKKKEKGLPVIGSCLSRNGENMRRVKPEALRAAFKRLWGK